MTTEEIVRITPQVVKDVLRRQAKDSEETEYTGPERRKTRRWPFPATAELRLDDDNATEQWFATCRDLSTTGMGVSTERHFEPGTRLAVSLHLPEATLYGPAVVRYCVDTPRGFMTGVDFCFD